MRTISRIILIATSVLLLSTSASADWDKLFGGWNVDDSSSVEQTTDGGYIILGTTYSYGAGRADFWLIRADANGVELWNKTFGGTLSDIAGSAKQTTDGGYIIVGTTQSFASGGGGDRDVWLIKTDADGNEVWDKTFGGLYGDDGCDVQQTTDDGYVIVGDTYGYVTHTAENVWLIKTDADGVKIWDKTFGGSSWDYGYSVQQTSDGGYIIVGTSNLVDVGGNRNDVWLIKNPVGRKCSGESGGWIWTLIREQ